MNELSRGEVFELYKKEVHSVAEDIAEEFDGLNKHQTVDGRKWCDDNSIPESVFSDAVNWYLEGVGWGISSMYPFRNEDEVVVTDYESEEPEEDSETENSEEDAGEE